MVVTRPLDNMKLDMGIKERLTTRMKTPKKKLYVCVFSICCFNISSEEMLIISKSLVRKNLDWAFSMIILDEMLMARKVQIISNSSILYHTTHIGSPFCERESCSSMAKCRKMVPVNKRAHHLSKHICCFIKSFLLI